MDSELLSSILCCCVHCYCVVLLYLLCTHTAVVLASIVYAAIVHVAIVYAAIVHASIVYASIVCAYIMHASIVYAAIVHAAILYAAICVRFCLLCTLLLFTLLLCTLPLCTLPLSTLLFVHAAIFCTLLLCPLIFCTFLLCMLLLPTLQLCTLLWCTGARCYCVRYAAAAYGTLLLYTVRCHCVRCYCVVGKRRRWTSSCLPSAGSRTATLSWLPTAREPSRLVSIKLLSWVMTSELWINLRAHWVSSTLSFIYWGSSHRHKSAACPPNFGYIACLFQWGGGDNFLFQIIFTCLFYALRKDGRVGILWFWPFSTLLTLELELSNRILITRVWRWSRVMLRCSCRMQDGEAEWPPIMTKGHVLYQEPFKSNPNNKRTKVFTW